MATLSMPTLENQSQEAVSLGHQTLLASTATPVQAISWPGDEPLVAICMATYNCLGYAPQKLSLQEDMALLVF